MKGEGQNWRQRGRKGKGEKKHLSVELVDSERQIPTKEKKGANGHRSKISKSSEGNRLHEEPFRGGVNP